MECNVCYANLLFGRGVGASTSFPMVETSIVTDALQATSNPAKISRAEVTAHNGPADIWIIVGDDVFDVSSFQEEHPGGAKCKQNTSG